MRSPWLDIPLADYEAHMALPSVAQSVLMSDQLDYVVRTYSPRSVAILGCAGGNGFDRLIGTGVNRLVGIDLNPEYIDAARRRYAGIIGMLELHIADIQTSTSLFEPVELIYAALVLEYVDLALTLDALRCHCKPNGILAVLFQLPHATMAEVSPSPYSSLQLLAPNMRLVAPQELQRQATRAGFVLEQSRTISSPGGKHFCVAEFRQHR